jgi:hypothetical protein
VMARRSEPATPRSDPITVHAADEQTERSNLTAVTELLSGLPTAFAKGRTDGLTATAAARAQDLRTALPPGATVSVEPETWRRTGRVGSIMVRVLQPDERRQIPFIVVLVQEHDGWNVSTTYRATS